MVGRLVDRRWLAAALAALTLAPLAAAADSEPEMDTAEEAAEALNLRLANNVNAHPAECARLRRQIDHFTMMHKRAETLESELWEARTQEHLNLLRGMQAARCPKDVPVDTTAEALKQLLILAAKGAATYFSMGMAGF
jgi:hypothetical protein